MVGPIAVTSYGKLQGREEDGVNVWRGIPLPLHQLESFDFVRRSHQKLGAELEMLLNLVQLAISQRIREVRVSVA